MTHTSAPQVESGDPKSKAERSERTHMAREAFDRTLAGLDDAAGYMAQARLKRLGARLETGSTPNWLLLSLLIIFIGLLIIAL